MDSLGRGKAFRAESSGPAPLHFILPRRLDARRSEVCQRAQGAPRRCDRTPTILTCRIQDILFVLYYVIVWAFVRQFLTIHVLRPLAKRLGVTKEEKLDRFGEQGYAVIYFSFFGAMGIVSGSSFPFEFIADPHRRL